MKSTQCILVINFIDNVGRVLNRFSKDIGFMDALLPNKLLDCITVSDKMYIV